MKNQIKEINSTTHPALFAAMDAYVLECGFWAYPDAEWQNNFIDFWLGFHDRIISGPEGDYWVPTI